MKTKPRPVDFINERDDLKAALMGSLGFSTRFISESTGLTPCQVCYRLGKAEIRRSEYRNGETKEAREAANWSRMFQGRITESVRKRLTKTNIQARRSA